MTNKTDGERLERVEANLETLTKLVEGQTKAQETMNKTLQEIKEAQIVSATNNASKEYVDTKVHAVDMKLETKLEAAKKRTSLQTWVTGSLSAVFGAVLSLLIAYFITTVGRQ